ncbi:MAG TPA: MBL fold metallo-hydrolase [Anaerolineales bacterium]|nr:MBL fold metallo-hydrolase [Anaerolineales bacterium]
MKPSRTKVILLGTGNPNPDPKHQGCSLIILVDETPYVVDFGAGLVRQTAALTPEYGGALEDRRPLVELQIPNLKTAFLTHMHSDHTVGYPDLILTPWVMGRDTPLEVYGPEGIVEMTDHILQAYQKDIHYRLQGLEHANDQGWRVNTHEIGEGMIYETDEVKVEAFLVRHGTMPNAYGFRFTTPDKVVVISGDTAPCENILRYSQGADILIHEVYYKKAFDRQSASWQRYHATHHTSTLELAEIARKTQPGLLVLYHMLLWGGSEQDLLDEIAEGYAGKVVVGADLQVFE